MLFIVKTVYIAEANLFQCIDQKSLISSFLPIKVCCCLSYSNFVTNRYCFLNLDDMLACSLLDLKLLTLHK